MAHTRIISTKVVEYRRGYREQAKPIFTTNRYRVTEERGSETSTWHENRTSVYMSSEHVETNFSTVELPNGKFIEIDTRHDRIWRNEAVHVVIYTIMGRTIVDLFYDERKTFSTWQFVQFPDPDKRLPVFLGLVIAGGLYWYKRDFWFSASTGAYLAIGLYVLLHLRQTYADKRFKLMRAMTERKLRKAVLRGQVIQTC